MFESISIFPHYKKKKPLDIGDLAEKMLYYREVILFANENDFVYLFQYFDINTLIEYLDNGYLKIKNRKKHYGVGLKEGAYLADFLYAVDYDLKKIISNAYYKFSGDAEKSKKVANRLYKYIGIWETPSDFSRQINLDLSDSKFTNQAIVQNIRYYMPHDTTMAADIEFNVKSENNGNLNIETNIDFKKYTFFDTSSIVLNIGTALENIKIAANYSSEISVPELDSKIISAKVNSLITEAEKSSKQLELFQCAEFHNSPSIVTVINEKHKTMKEFLEILKKGEKFKVWLSELGPDNNLINEYISKVTEKSWIQSLPSKAVRFYLLQSISAILKADGSALAIMSALALSAMNTFLLDKLIKGWKPNQFIRSEVLPFLKSDME